MSQPAYEEQLPKVNPVKFSNIRKHKATELILAVFDVFIR